jgi:OOP family OmpA-OmpF porin
MIKKIFAAAALAALAASAQAAQPGSVYAGVDAGLTKGDDMSSKASYGAFLGYNLSQNFALETGYRRLWSGTEQGMDGRIDQFAVSLLGSVPVADNLSLYGRLGYNRLEAKVDAGALGSYKDKTSRALLGVGFKYDVDQHYSLRMEVQRPASGTTNLSLGLGYAF